VERKDGTVSVVDPFTAPDAAVIVATPGATPVASPPAAIVAIVLVLEFQVTEAVKS
jgi:hypothetical protein